MTPATKPFNLYQPWRCEACTATGETPFAITEDVITIAHRLEDEHREKSPHCAGKWGRKKIRVGRVQHLGEDVYADPS